jgi:NTE family protein
MIGMIKTAWLLSLIYIVHGLEQLSFSGGGSFGAVEIGILQKIRESYPVKYDMYTGISAGGLNSGFLSHYESINEGILESVKLYSSMRNKDIYEAFPETGLSLLNTQPLHRTLTEIIDNMENEPVIETMIGAVNLYTGNLDIYKYNDNNTTEEKVRLLMSTSAIPVVFPPVEYKNAMYVDGGTLSNALLDIDHTNEYINITYITPYGIMTENDDPIKSTKEMMLRVFQLVKKNFNNPFARLNHNCDVAYGELNYYYVDESHLKNYNMLNFDKGMELITIGYNNVKSKKYRLC